MRFAHDFFHSKTTWTGIAGIVTAFAISYLTAFDWRVAALAALAYLQQMFRRDADAKAKEEVVASNAEVVQAVRETTQAVERTAP